MTPSRVQIVTPCFNAADTIGRTIASVISQEGDFELRYHLQDGGSSDDTLKIIEHWQGLVQSGALPLACRSLRLTWQTAPDGGIYDAICRGVEALDPQPDDWMGWINADDILMPGAAALLARIDATEGQRHIGWVTGGMGIVSHGTIIAHGPRPQSSEILRLGLADGRHWEYVQQEGVFFRNRLWRELDLEADFRSMKYAGDWNLWRRLAERHDVYQVDRALGGFRLREGQTSAQFRDRYEAETEALAPLGERLQGLRALRAQAPFRRTIAFTYPDAEVFTREEPLQAELSRRLADMVGPHHDDAWGEADTERRAFEAVRDSAPLVASIAYVGFPWSALIDAVEQRSPQAAELLDRLSVVALGAAAERRITVCEHPRMLEHRGLFEQCGVTDVFWPHAHASEAPWPGTPSITLHPFPLHAERGQGGAVGRPHLFCAPADAAGWEPLAADPRGLAISDFRTSGDGALARSAFALCPLDEPCGRALLWGAVATGTIPVLIGGRDGLPGAAALWDEAAVLADNELSAALADRLQALADDAEAFESKRRAVQQLRLLYGAENLIHDLRRAYASAGGGPAWSALGKSVEASRGRPQGPMDKVRVHLQGSARERSLLTCAAYRPHFQDDIEFVSEAAGADLIVGARSCDFDAEVQRGARDGGSSRLIVLAEGPEPAAVSPAAGVVVLDHETSDIFDFARIPFALTTSDERIARYNALFAGDPPRTRDLVQRWKAAGWPVVIIAGDADAEAIAARLHGARTLTLRPAHGPLAGPDPHLAKLALLRGRAYLISALEGCDQARRVSPAFFDAFACGAAPICRASEFHHVYRLAPGGFVNLADLGAEGAAELLRRRTPTTEFAEVWLETRQRLAALFCDPVSLASERKLVAQKVLAALREVRDGTWRPTPPQKIPLRPPLSPALARPATAVLLVERREDGPQRHLRLQLSRPRIGDIRPERLRFGLTILHPGVFRLTLERRDIVPHYEAEELDWRLADGLPLGTLSLFVNTTNRRVLWSGTASAALHAFVAALAKELPVILRELSEPESAAEDWAAAASALQRVGVQWLAQTGSG